MKNLHFGSLDMLQKSGIIGFDANSFLNGLPQVQTHPQIPNPNIKQPNSPTQNIPQTTLSMPEKDLYTQGLTNLEEKENKQNKLKKYGAIALCTYIAGFIASKGQVNPLKGLKALGSLTLKILSPLTKIFKKS